MTLLIRILIAVVVSVGGLTIGGLVAGMVGLITVGPEAYQRAFESRPWGSPAIIYVAFYVCCGLAAGLFTWFESASWIRRFIDHEVVADGEDIYRVRGGARCPSKYGLNMYATWPFAWFSVSSQRLELKVMDRYFTFTKDDVIRLTRRRGIISPGLEIVTSSGDAFVFFSFDMERLIVKVRFFGYTFN